MKLYLLNKIKKFIFYDLYEECIEEQYFDNYKLRKGEKYEYLQVNINYRIILFFH